LVLSALTYFAGFKRTENAMTTDYLPALRRLLKEHEVSTVYYSGYAHEDVIELLIESFQAGCIQGMDMIGRLTEDQLNQYKLRGVSFWTEGGPRGELTIKDYPWGHDKQLAEIIEWRPKPAPRIYFLADQARTIERHPFYQWHEFETATVAIQRQPNPDTWIKMKEKHLRYYKEEEMLNKRSPHGTK